MINAGLFSVGFILQGSEEALIFTGSLETEEECLIPES